MRLPLLFTLFAAMTVSVSSAPAVEIIGHRGASHDAPENTAASFNLGWKQEADADELDIYLTQDSQIIVIHDADAKRTTGVAAAVAKSTLAELRALDAGSWKGEAWKGEKLPTLREALATIPDGKRMFIEIKCGPEVLPALEADLRACGKKPEQLVLIGFGYKTMVEAKKRLPQLQVFWIVGHKKDESPRLDAMIDQAKAGHLDGLDLDGRFPIDSTWVAQVKAAGLRLYVWTVDDPALAARFSAAGVEGITTNRPGWLRQQLSTSGAF
jgi:glycerophosphoryl diester phosphodiesterase